MDAKKDKARTYKDWREARRFRAWELHKKGWPQKAIAEALGVTAGAVCQWIKTGREEGEETLRSATSRCGAKAKMTAAELGRLPKLLERGAAAYGFRGDVWTQARVAKVIQQEFGVKYSPRHVGRLLKQINWTVQKPIERAERRDEEEIAEWCDEIFPGLKKKRKKKGERSFS